jgi:hypothetical protein
MTRLRRPGAPLLGSIGAALALLAIAPAARPGTCRQNVAHPIEVRVQPLDPVRRNAPIRVRVTATARVSLARAEVRLVSAGGAQVQSAARVALGRLAPGRAATADFVLRLPEQGRRTYVQFHVEGEGPTGPWRRGAAYNFLPDGPADPGRRVTASDGSAVHEFTARRIEP